MSAATITLLFLLFAVVMFVFEKIPLGVTSMIVCIGLVVTGVLDIKTAFAGFIDSNVILFVAMFIVGGEQDFSNVPKWKQVLSLVILVLTLLGMIFEKQIGIKLCITGCIGALALILTGVISEKDALKSIDLKTIFLFGGTLSLASALDKTGAGAEIANIVIGALGENPSPYVLTLVVFLLCCVMTNFMSNTATTALMVPICLSIAQGMGADPRAVLMACVIGGSCAYATPIGMPANTMVVSAGGYTFKDYAKAGLPLILIATVVSMVILPIAFPFFPQ